MDSHKDIDKIGKKAFRALIFAVLSTLFTTTALGNLGDDKALLTPEERQWLNTHQSRIVLAVETGYAPFVFFDNQWRPTGLAHDFMRLIEEKIDASFQEKSFSSLPLRGPESKALASEGRVVPGSRSAGRFFE